MADTSPSRQILCIEDEPETVELIRRAETDTAKLARRLRARGFAYPLIRQVLEEQRPS